MPTYYWISRTNHQLDYLVIRILLILNHKVNYDLICYRFCTIDCLKSDSGWNRTPNPWFHTSLLFGLSGPYFLLFLLDGCCSTLAITNQPWSTDMVGDGQGGELGRLSVQEGNSNYRESIAFIYIKQSLSCHGISFLLRKKDDQIGRKNCLFAFLCWKIIGGKKRVHIEEEGNSL